MSSLIERLGFASSDRAVIIAANGLGTCHACNTGVYQALRDGIATTATLRVPCPWSRGAVADYQNEDVGVALTLTSEFAHYRWGPITHAPSLHGGSGSFASTAADVWDHADPSEVLRESRAQVERALLWGIDLTHLASHDDVMITRPELFDIIAELAEEFGLPVRLAQTSIVERAGFPVLNLAAERGLIHVDEVVDANSSASLVDLLESIKPGVTEIGYSPAKDTSELRAITDRSSTMVDDLALLTADQTRQAFERAGVRLIGYRDLKALAES